MPSALEEALSSHGAHLRNKHSDTSEWTWEEEAASLAKLAELSSIAFPTMDCAFHVLSDAAEALCTPETDDRCHHSRYNFKMDVASSYCARCGQLSCYTRLDPELVDANGEIILCDACFKECDRRDLTASMICRDCGYIHELVEHSLFTPCVAQLARFVHGSKGRPDLKRELVRAAIAKFGGDSIVSLGGARRLENMYDYSHSSSIWRRSEAEQSKLRSPFRVPTDPADCALVVGLLVLAAHASLW